MGDVEVSPVKTEDENNMMDADEAAYGQILADALDAACREEDIIIDAE